MPLSTRREFYDKYGGSKTLPRFAPKPSRGTLMAQRNKRVSIMEAARRRSKIAMRYQKVSGEVKTYLVEPYSYRYKKLRAGIRKVLYAYHFDPKRRKGTIKMFVLRGVKNVRVTYRRYRPRWKIEL